MTGSDAPALSIPVELADLRFQGRCQLRDLWKQEAVGEFTGTFAPEIPWHGRHFPDFRTVIDDLTITNADNP